MWLKLLDYIGLTNLTNERIALYYELKRKFSFLKRLHISIEILKRLSPGPVMEKRENIEWMKKINRIMSNETVEADYIKSKANKEDIKAEIARIEKILQEIELSSEYSYRNNIILQFKHIGYKKMPEIERCSRFDKLYSPVDFDSGEIFQSLIDWFKGQSKLMTKDRGYQQFWSGKLKQAVTESTIDGLIRGPLNKYVNQRGAHLSPEEETSEGKLDYLVSRANDKVVIELKRSVNKTQCEIGIVEQLPIYMINLKCKYGIYVIFCFNNAYQKESQEIIELCKLRDNVCREKNLQIKIITINCDPPLSMNSKRGGGQDSGRFNLY